MRMIFHVPFELDPASASPGHIRPLKMLAAFRALGYDVDVVQGRNRERKSLAAAVRARIKAGVDYSFVYSECASLPTALTDPSRYPTHPFFDLSFLRFCRSRGLKVGLFYRDVFWRFRNMGQYRSAARHAILALFHLFDIAAYHFSISRMYLPSMAMHRFIPLASGLDGVALPPGHDVTHPSPPGNPARPLRLLYVGGLGAIYDLHAFMEVVHRLPNVHFTLCTRPADWQREGPSYESLVGNNVSIVHEKGDGLSKLYADADVAVYFLKPTEYSEFAVSVKVFEYIGNCLPIVAVQATRVGAIVESEGVGWTLPFDKASLHALLTELSEKREVVSGILPRLREASKLNTWIARAQTVVNDLSQD